VTGDSSNCFNPKREKDVLQAAVLVEALAEKHDFVLKEAIENLGSKLKSRIRRGVKRALALVGKEAPKRRPCWKRSPDCGIESNRIPQTPKT